MDICPTHSKQYSVFCQNCESLLCLKCLDSHGRLGHVILSSEGATDIFREKLTEFHQQLIDKQNAIAHQIQEITEKGTLFERSSESFEEFSGQIFSVFQRIEEILGELKTSIFTKYTQEFEQRSSINQIQQLRKSSTQLEKEIKKIESAESDTSNWIDLFESVKDSKRRVQEAALLEVPSGCRRDGDGECRGSRARPTAATVAIEVLQTLRTQLQHAEELHSAGSSL